MLLAIDYLDPRSPAGLLVRVVIAAHNGSDDSPLCSLLALLDSAGFRYKVYDGGIVRLPSHYGWQAADWPGWLEAGAIFYSERMSGDEINNLIAPHPANPPKPLAKQEAVTKIVRHLLGICKVLIVYFGVESYFARLFDYDK